MIGARVHDFIVPGRPISKMFEEIKDLGYGTIQLAPHKILENYSVHEVGIKEIEYLKAELDKASLTVSVLGCYIDPASLDEQERVANVETFINYLTFAKILNAPIVGTETGSCSDKDESGRNQRYAKLKESLATIAVAAEKEGVLVGLEAVVGSTLNSAEITERIIRDVGSKQLKVIFDPANIIAPAEISLKQQQQTIAEFIDLLGPKIQVLHVKNFVVNEGHKKMVSLDEGVVVFEAVFNWHNKQARDIPILRENSMRESDVADILFIENHLNRD